MTTAALQAVRESWRQLERARLKLFEAHRRGEPMANCRAEMAERIQREVRMLGEVLAGDVESLSDGMGARKKQTDAVRFSDSEQR